LQSRCFSSQAAHPDPVAGDFGFFDEGSANRLSNRELAHQVAHSELSQTEKDRTLTLPRDGKNEAVRERQLLGGFQSLLDEIDSLHVSVYAVLGGDLLL
jgi:hypothetical protein